MEIITCYLTNEYLFISKKCAEEYAEKFEHEIAEKQYFKTDEGWKKQNIRSGNLEPVRLFFEDNEDDRVAVDKNA